MNERYTPGSRVTIRLTIVLGEFALELFEEGGADAVIELVREDPYTLLDEATWEVTVEP